MSSSLPHEIGLHIASSPALSSPLLAEAFSSVEVEEDSLEGFCEIDIERLVTRDALHLCGCLWTWDEVKPLLAKSSTLGSLRTSVGLNPKRTACSGSIKKEEVRRQFE
jgi:hypothetical protein